MTREGGTAPDKTEGERPPLAVVLVTAPVGQAERIVEELLAARVIACANVSPALSVYRWKGAVQRDEESLLVLKTTADRLRELERRLMALHPYDVPEFVALPTRACSEAYADWVRSETGVPDSPD